MSLVFPRAALAASLLYAALLFSPVASLAMDGVMLGSLTITNAFARAMPPNAPTAGGFVTITNHGVADDRLVSASSPRAPEVQLHEMSIDANNVMVMRQLPDGIAIPAGATVELTPGGLHLMFIHPVPGFKLGETVAVTLHFETAGDVTLKLPVAGLGATEMPMDMNMKAN